MRRFLILTLIMSIAFPAIQRAQSTLNFGIKKRQTEAELPKSRSDNPVEIHKKAKKTDVYGRLIPKGNCRYELADGWELASAASVVSKPFFSPDFDTSDWYDATVPGTVLTTLVDQGVFPDPYYGLNNLEIPDTLCRTDWWYRIKFDVADSLLSDNPRLLFNGINYRAEVWLNGNRLGKIDGAFTRKYFDVKNILSNTGNVLAVRISPPDNPGIAHEQNSVEFGPNGGALCLDGPTFIVSEGWDWMPAMRDRNAGIWQNVCLCFDKGVIIGDTQIITDLPLPDTTSAKLTVKIPVKNTTDENISFDLSIAMDRLALSRKVFLSAGEERVEIFSPETDKEMVVRNPALWWPNGYGEQNLYDMKIIASMAGKILGEAEERFGFREMSMELAVDTDDVQGLRIEYSPTNTDKFLFDYTELRDAMVPNRNTFIPRLAEGASPEDYSVAEQNGNPYIVIKINGVPIFCKGGNWGIDDAMKRCSRERLEPAFKLHEMENFNMIRVWTGECMEEDFYDLCDEYGMLVWNDFWMSTGNYNLMPLDYDLFLDNVTDAVRRFRNHPSIVVWCPRNEGYAEDLEDDFQRIILAEDGTRHYHGNSRELNMPGSGPWGYHDEPLAYFERLAYGFNSELGSNSVPPYSTMVKFIPEEDRWPVGDVWYYHDWHVNGWSGWDAFMRDLERLSEYPCTDLKEFCRRADILNYNGHKIMFEAYNHKMWNFTSGVLYWMSHPAWPSLICQTYSWDWQTFGTFFGCKKACEPLHIQWNIDDRKLVAVNASMKEYKNVKASFEVFSLSGEKLDSYSETIDIPANKRVDMSEVSLPEYDGICLVRLKLQDRRGNILSANDYWYNGDKYTNAPVGLCDIDKTKLKVSVEKKDGKWNISISNTGNTIAALVRTNLISSVTDSPVLPAYPSDNYFNLLPGESRTVELSCPSAGNETTYVKTEGVNCENSVTGNPLPDWAFGGFVRYDANPVLSPDTSSVFYCSMQKRMMRWEESETFNPAAVVKDDKIVLLYRAEDNTAQGIGSRTSRIGYAESSDGFTMVRRKTPVMYPGEDNNRKYEWMAGCEDPRVTVTEDGLYVMMYTGAERMDEPHPYAIARLCVATSRDLVHWTKHGPAFEKAYGGKFKDNWTKSGSIVTKIVNGKQVIAKVNGKYLMYWGESMVNLATSDDLINWTPTVDSSGNLLPVMSPREGYFDATLVECGPPAIITDDGILLIYNGKNAENGDKRFPPQYYCGGQALFDLDDPQKLIGRLDNPFFIPRADFEKTGQYTYGGLFLEGLVYFKGKWYLYYGCSDSHVAVAVYDPEHTIDGDPLP